jgi:hypothetical protein
MVERPLRVRAESNPDVGVVVEQRTDRGDTAKGQRPYVCIDSVKYTTESLGSMPEAIGHRILVEIDARDMRTVHGHLKSRGDIGVLTATTRRRTRRVQHGLNHLGR